ncbi:conserved hypothetical protein [Mesorhizobium prunaredense]|uniref:DUF4258 domain-containing protein n=1 Tax=Mesorhizobium prunaredense TaxID=1631249 RepID=A0A1R3V8P9_9HYPH|nr:DUF4258 domain-containing protein [Mesorhizobium prunaredense]SIT56267.1 conserved hypothetical protein [Mesorhizobium prunaredense]
MIAKRPLLYTNHAETVIRQRSLDKRWIERAVWEPDWQAADVKDTSVIRLYKQVPENGGRILRVVCVATPEEIRIPSVYFDRGARRPR